MLRFAVVVAALLAMASPGRAQDPGPVWPKLSPGQRAEAVRFSDDYRQFIGRAKSELTFVREAVRLVEASGFKHGRATIAQSFANAEIDTIGVGIGVLSMHSPMEVLAKVDLWELYKGFKFFLGAPTSPSTGPTAR